MQEPTLHNAPPQLPAPKTCGLAVASLISSLCLIFPAAIICGHIAQSRIRTSGGQLKGGGMAMAGLIIGYGTIPLCLVILPMMSILFVGARAWKRGADRAQCLMAQRNITTQLQSYCSIKDLKPGDPIPLDEALIAGTIRTCPEGASLTIATEVPADGESYVFCPDPMGHDHSPTVTSDWQEEETAPSEEAIGVGRD